MPVLLPVSSGFLIREVLRTGSRSVVVRAMRLSDNAPVILKSPSSGGANTTQWARLHSEKTILRTLQGEGIVRLVGDAQLDGRPALVLADCGGRSLREVASSGQMTRDLFLEVATQTARALAAIHRQGVIHHDLNPSNIVFNPTRMRLEIIDFGLASTLVEETPDPEDPIVQGTLCYLSPEQTGRTNRKVDYRTDFYALGATFYELLVGSPPFESGDPLELIHCHLARRPVAPVEMDSSIGEGLSDLIMRLLAKTPEERYQSAEGLSDDLDVCRRAHARGEAAARFTLGTTDFSARLSVPDRLYGRDEEQRILLEALNAAVGGDLHIALVHGPPGVGKSALVQELRPPIHSVGGTFLYGKCDELHRNRPYFGLVQALRQLVRILLAASPVAVDNARRALLESIGDFGGLLVEVVPEVERIIGVQPRVPELQATEAAYRRDRIFGQFIRCVAGPHHPLVLYLDDLQWADFATLGVFESLAETGDARHVLLVGAYRDDGLDAANPLHTTLLRLHASRTPVLDMRLLNLSPVPVGRLVADALSSTTEAVALLSRIAVAKTAGNPFFLRQFLAALHDQGLLSLNRAARTWTWDLEQIRGADITDNVADLMVHRVGTLPEDTQEVLRAAACVGAAFNLDELATAVDMPPREVAEALRAALQQGLIIPQGGGRILLEVDTPRAREISFAFLHDRVRHAAASMLDPQRRAELHLAMGRRLRARLQDVATDDGVFEVVTHFQGALPLVTEASERYDVARLHLEAGRRASRAAAFEVAMNCLQTALSLLHPDGWEREPSLSMDVHLAAAAAASATGSPQRTHDLIDTALSRARHPLEQARVLEVRIGEHILHAHHEAAWSLGREALRLLGESIPDRSSRRALLSHLVRATSLISEPMEALADLPLASDPRHTMVLRLLSRLATAAYYVRPDMVPRLGLRQAELSVLHGLTVDSSRGFAAWGLLHASVTDDIDLAQKFGRLALRIGDRFPPGQPRTKMRHVVHHMVLPWKEPMRPIVDWTLEEHRACVQAGDRENGYMLAHAYCRMSYQAGTDLRLLDGEVDRMMGAVEALRRGPPPRYWGVLRQLLDNLLGRSETPSRLGAPGCDLEAEVEAALRSGDKFTAWVSTYEQTWLHLVFDEPAEALRLLPVLERLVGFMVGLPEVPHFHYLASLVRLRRGSPEDRREVRQNLQRLRLWAHHAPHNHAHRVHMVQAGLARLQGDVAAATAEYESAASCARDNGFPQDEALALEHAGTMFLEKGNLRLARSYLEDARKAWERWGAVARVADLNRRFPHLLPPSPSPSTATTESWTDSTRSGSSRLDAMSLIKVTQAVSGEIVLSRLLQRIMAIAMENAGAQRGFLVLERDGKLTIEADGDVDGEVVVRSLPVEAARLADSVVRFVARTRETVVLDDASVDPTFASDPYVQAVAARSILCLPIGTPAKHLGILYLQNDRARGAFTAARRHVLQVLAGQAAISLENARLYFELDEHRRTLEQRVTERTLELRGQNDRLAEALANLKQAQEQIVTQQKMAYLGTLTAGIAHEIRNPLSFVKNFAEMSMDLREDVRELVAGGSDAEGLVDLVNQMGDNAARIQEHALRADRVVQGMLLHAGSSSREFEVTSLNLILSQTANLALHGASDAAVRRVEVTLDLDETLPPVRVAPRDVARALLNIVGNALTAAASSEGPRVVVSTRRVDSRAIVRVRDNGPGIPPDLQDRIFAPFFTTRPTGQGTGLGLSIAWDIVVGQHGGRLWVESEAGRYAEFVIELPLEPGGSS